MSSTRQGTLSQAQRQQPSLAEGETRAFERSTRGRYIILDTIGRGGMGEVYAAYDPNLDRRVALKVMHPPDSAHSLHENVDVTRSRFLREARSLAALDHPNIVPIYDVGVFEDGDAYMAMMLVEGKSLSADLKRGALSVTAALEICIQAADALQHAHAYGLIHRDIKPQNIMRTERGHVWVLDFGLVATTENSQAGASVLRAALSRARGPSLQVAGTAPVPSMDQLVRGEAQAGDNSSLSDAPLRLTETGVLLGTPRYMAPEQYLGEPCGPATDIFALTIVLFELIHGRAAFCEYREYRRLQAIANRSLHWQEGLPHSLQQILTQGLAYEPSRRFASMGEFAEALRRELIRPYANKRRLLRSGALLVGAGILAAALIDMASNHHLLPACDSQPSFASEVVRSPQWQRIEFSFRNHTASTALSHWERLENRLRDWTTNWRQVELKRCELERKHLEIDQEDRPAQVGASLAEDTELIAICLQQRKQDFLSLLHMLDKPLDATKIRQTPQLVDALGNPRDCADPALYLAQAPLPHDPLARLAATRIRNQLQSAALFRMHAEHELAGATLDEVSSQLESSSDLSLLSQYASQRAFLAEANHDRPQTMRLHDKAILLAIAARWHQQAAQGNLQLVYVRAYRNGDFADATELKRNAEALSRAAGRPLELEVNLQRMQGVAYASLGDFHNALPHFLASLAAINKLGRADSIAAAQALDDIGLSYANFGKPKIASYYYQQALTIILNLLGDDNPRTARLYALLANAARDQDDFLAMARHANQALESCLSSGIGEDLCGAAYRRVGEAALSRGDTHGAIDQFLAWQAGQEAKGAREGRAIPWVEAPLCLALLGRGESDTAIEVGKLALLKYRRELAVPSDLPEAAAYCLFDAYLFAGEVAAARDVLDSLAPISASSDASPQAHRLDCMAHLAASTGQHAQALAYWHDAIVSLPADEATMSQVAPLLLAMSQSHLHLSQVAAATTFAEQAYEYRAASIGILPHLFLDYELQLSRCYLAQGSYDLAQTWFTLAQSHINPAETSDQQLRAVSALASSLDLWR